jgi:hypothetical protein
MRRGLAILDFAWHLRGSIKPRNDVSDEVVLDRVQDMLEAQGKGPERGTNSVIFENAMSGFWMSWRATSIYDGGRFWIDHHRSGRRLRYKLRSFQVFVFCTVAALFFFFFGLLGGVQNGLKFGAIAFAWVYGMNVALALIRVPALIRRTVRGD